MTRDSLGKARRVDADAAQPQEPPAPFDALHAPSLANWLSPSPELVEKMHANVALECGWGRLIFGHTFADDRELAATLCSERVGQRDVALYLRDPHVVISRAPERLFLDPSHTFRLDLTRFERPAPHPRIGVRGVQQRSDVSEMQRLFQVRHMVPPDPEFVWQHREDQTRRYLVAFDMETGEVLGTVTGVDHVRAFNDPEQGASLWTLAVDPDARSHGVGEALVRALASLFQELGRRYLDLSVLADNEGAIALYTKLGFQRVPVFCLKHKHNPVNEQLYLAAEPSSQLNPYARIVVDEARRRGIAVEILDGETGHFRLTHGGRSVVCWESLSELTSAVAMVRCADKQLTLRIMRQAGLHTAESVVAGSAEQNRAFLAEHGRIVVKPVDGEQGRGVSVDVRTPEQLTLALERASLICSRVMLERYVEGLDLRIVVINDEVVAAAERRPARVVGDGQHSVFELIEKQSRRRAAATGGESRIPIDAETERCVEDAGYRLSSVLSLGHELWVRKTANLHTGGTLHDVTQRLHPTLRDAALRAARALSIPVVGMDLRVPDVEGPSYVIIEANERPGLANHEPHPTAERYLDLLFPQTAHRAFS